MEGLLVFVPKMTSRIRYVFRLVFKDLLKVTYTLTTNLDEFLSADAAKIVYADKAYSDDIFFKSSGLLFQRGIENIKVENINFEGNKALFPVYDKNSALPFDVFSAIFYLVSRYEEYQLYVSDIHGRFTAHLSLSAELNILDKPMVNIWSVMIKKIILDKYPDFNFPKRNYRFRPTYDIDTAFAYSQKGLVRSVGGYLLSVKNFDWSDIVQRSRVLFSGFKDPFDTFDLQIEFQRRYNLKPIYFFLFGHYGKFDKNVNTRNRSFRFLIKKMGDYAQIGIHPSYYTNENPEMLQKEIKYLESVVNKDITQSRQHFLRLNLPGTYRNLIDEDITDDYSMGYAALPGFRAGICSPFNFYDLDIEVETKLRVHPFVVMDGTLKDYMKLTPADAIEQIKKLINEVKKVDGTFSSLWHNEPLSDEKRWKGWRKVYEELLVMAAEE
ncbi:MAG: polysaccharide deacetylase family protein [Bacteroidetes bacterium]|nr:polysaccharide deacetylase family protein [Bacteroidota bacterium]MBL6943070.1 polysaccharide deacetylase family protein [Bacteroidales bacterium]